jgi:hypothetical protein
MTKRQKKAKLNAEIKKAFSVRESFLATLREETDKDYREGLYINLDNCDKHIRELECQRDAL